MSFLYMIVVVSVVFMLSFYAIELYREYVQRSVEEEIIQFEKKTTQDALDLDIIITYLEMHYGYAHSTVDVRGTRSVHQQESGTGPEQSKGERNPHGIYQRMIDRGLINKQGEETWIR